MSRGHLRPLAAPAIGVMSLAALVATLITHPPPPPDDIGASLAVYEWTAAALPGAGPVAFIGTATSGTDDGAHRALVRYALAPRRVVDGLSDVEGVLTGPRAPADLDAAMAAQGFQLARVAPNGVRAYRR